MAERDNGEARGRVAQIVVGALALVALVFLLVRVLEDPGAGSVQPAERSSEDVEPEGELVAPPVAPDDAAPREPARAVEDVVEPAEPAEPSGSEAGGAAGDDPKVMVEGSWTVIDANGAEWTNVDGRFLLRPYRRDGDREVEVRGGHFRVELFVGDRFDIREIELGDRPTAAVSDVWGIEVPSDGRIDFVARWVSPVVLSVIDAKTREHLSDLTVLGEGIGTAWEHPGPFGEERVLLREVSSPITLPIPENPDDREQLWVSGPRHGWGQIVVPRSVGGEFLLALHPAGRIEVTLVGAPEGVALALRLRRNADAEDWEGQRYEEWVEGRERIVLESLAADRYVVTVELGHRYRNPRVLAYQEVDLTSAESAEVVLDVSGFEFPPVADLSGTLVVPPAWELSSFDLFVELIGEPALDGQPQRRIARHDMRVLDAETGEHAFGLQDLRTGRWELRFNPLGTSLAVDLPPVGLSDVRLEVPPPVDVSVLVRDPEGNEVSDVQVNWMPDRSELNSGGVLNGAGRRGPGVFGFTAPLGSVEVWCFSDTWGFHREIYDLEEVGPEIEIELEPACGLVLTAREGTTALRIVDFDPSVKLAEGEEEGYLQNEDDTGLTQRYVVPGPGLYRVEVTVPEGYRPVEPVTLSIAPAEFAELTIDVERE